MKSKVAIDQSVFPQHRPFRFFQRPGLVLMALSQGAGELIWWPYLVAKYGLSFLWILPIAAVAQYPINYALGYYTAASGKGFFRLLAELDKRVACFIWMLFALSFIWFGAYATSAGTAGAEIIKEMGAGNVASDQALSLMVASLIVVACLPFLTVKRTVWVNVQRVLSFAAVAVTAILLLSFASRSVRSCALPVLGALFPSGGIRLPNNWQPRDWPILISGLLFTGLGGFWNVLYSYMVKAEGVGRNAQSGSEFRFDETFESPSGVDSKWLSQLRKRIHCDVAIGVVGNFITTVLICILAYSFLTNYGEIPSGWRLVVVQKEMFSWIPIVGPYLFLLMAFFFLADTWVATTDSVARAHVDFWVNLRRRTTVFDQHKYYVSAVILLTGLTAGTMYIAQPRTLLMINGIISALAMLLVIGVLMAIGFKSAKQEDRWWNAGVTLLTFLTCSGFFYAVSFVLYWIHGR